MVDTRHPEAGGEEAGAGPEGEANPGDLLASFNVATFKSEVRACVGVAVCFY